MRIATWNVNSIRARQARVAGWLEQHAPDVLCLQEIKCVDDEFPAADLAALGYRAEVHGERTYNGVAILARQPLVDPARGFGDGEDEPDARLIAATVAGIRVVSVYVPNGKEVGHERYHYKLGWLARLRRYLERCCDPAAPLVLCGDFNVAPGDLDVWDPALWQGRLMCSDGERSGFADLLSWGLTDLYRHHRAEDPGFTWWDYRQLAFPKRRGLRIDFLLATAPLVARLTDIAVDREARKGKLPSDHAPVVAEFADRSPVSET